MWYGRGYKVSEYVTFNCVNWLNDRVMSKKLKTVCKCPSCVSALAEKQKPETCLVNSDGVCRNVSTVAISQVTQLTDFWFWLSTLQFNISIGSVFGPHVAGRQISFQSTSCSSKTHKTKQLYNTIAMYRQQRNMDAYLIFVISFTQAKFLENKIYTEKRVNYKNGFRDKIA